MAAVLRVGNGSPSDNLVVDNLRSAEMGKSALLGRGQVQGALEKKLRSSKKLENAA